jgi:hypothetical protein
MSAINHPSLEAFEAHQHWRLPRRSPPSLSSVAPAWCLWVGVRLRPEEGRDVRKVLVGVEDRLDRRAPAGVIGLPEATEQSWNRLHACSDGSGKPCGSHTFHPPRILASAGVIRDARLSAHAPVVVLPVLLGSLPCWRLAGGWGLMRRRRSSTAPRDGRDRMRSAMKARRAERRGSRISALLSGTPFRCTGAQAA